MCKAMASTEAQDVAEAYEECVFRRFGASEMIQIHDSWVGVQALLGDAREQVARDPGLPTLG
ncbi:hypothetical protein PHMEG_00038601 [Phytophthora megakarya]|uniref:Reverse transcriptase n=1 Tax=Phytophthora megakarya TaxID=4795 RepID=A0A225UH41_9STRA|nr:hypothetical protein PHMEG_00038601 [Phytophthora megakarya]